MGSGAERTDTYGIDGYINADGDHPLANHCVRPVLHLDLSKRSCWTYAGTVCASDSLAEQDEENFLPAPASVTPRCLVNSRYGHRIRIRLFLVKMIHRFLP